MGSSSSVLSSGTQSIHEDGNGEQQQEKNESDDENKLITESWGSTDQNSTQSKNNPSGVVETLLDTNIDDSVSLSSREVITKSQQDRQFLTTSLQRNFIFETLSESQQLDDLIDVFTPISCNVGIVIEQGNSGEFMYVIDSGKFEMTKTGETKVGSLSAGDCFGELALLYNAESQATVTCIQKGKLWKLDRKTFKHYRIASLRRSSTTLFKILGNVPLFNKLNVNDLTRLCEVAEPLYFPEGDIIIKKGDFGNTFYIIMEGLVNCSDANFKNSRRSSLTPSPKSPSSPFNALQSNSNYTAGSSLTIPSIGGDGGPDGSVRLGVGEWFGEVALLEEKVVQVEVVADSPVRLLAFEREHFEKVLGNLKDLIEREVDNKMLSELPIIAKIPEERRKIAVNMFSVENYEDGDTIAKCGDVNPRLIVMKSGEAFVWHHPQFMNHESEKFDSTVSPSLTLGAACRKKLIRIDERFSADVRITCPSESSFDILEPGEPPPTIAQRKVISLTTTGRRLDDHHLQHQFKEEDSQNSKVFKDDHGSETSQGSNIANEFKDDHSHISETSQGSNIANEFKDDRSHSESKQGSNRTNEFNDDRNSESKQGGNIHHSHSRESNKGSETKSDEDFSSVTEPSSTPPSSQDRGNEKYLSAAASTVFDEPSNTPPWLIGRRTGGSSSPIQPSNTPPWLRAPPIRNERKQEPSGTPPSLIGSERKEELSSASSSSFPPIDEPSGAPPSLIGSERKQAASSSSSPPIDEPSGAPPSLIGSERKQAASSSSSPPIDEPPPWFIGSERKQELSSASSSSSPPVDEPSGTPPSLIGSERKQAASSSSSPSIDEPSGAPPSLIGSERKQKLSSSTSSPIDEPLEPPTPFFRGSQNDISSLSSSSLNETTPLALHGNFIKKLPSPSSRVSSSSSSLNELTETAPSIHSASTSSSSKSAQVISEPEGSPPFQQKRKKAPPMIKKVDIPLRYQKKSTSSSIDGDTIEEELSQSLLSTPKQHEGVFRTKRCDARFDAELQSFEMNSTSSTFDKSDIGRQEANWRHFIKSNLSRPTSVNEEDDENVENTADFNDSFGRNIIDPLNGPFDENQSMIVAGDCVGEDSIFNATPMNCTVIAKESVTCFVLSRTDLISALFDDNPSDDPLNHRSAKDYIDDDKPIVWEKLVNVGKIGAGTFGTVYLMKHKVDKMNYALKVVDVKKENVAKHENRIITEIEILKQMKSPYICKLHANATGGGKYFMVLEYVPGGHFKKLIRPPEALENRVERNQIILDGKLAGMPHQAAKFYIATISIPLVYIHRRGIAFRDLKPENIMIDRFGYPKLVDFGLSKRIDALGKTFTLCGTTEYMAPEIILGDGHNQAVDWWALGIVLYEMVVGVTPFLDMKAPRKKHQQMKTFQRIIRGKFQCPAAMEDGCKILIQKLLHPKPVFRLGCCRRGNKEFEEHEWFQGEVDWVALNIRQMRPPWIPSG